jgi:hypothetical protein
LNNPSRYTDPSGFIVCQDIAGGCNLNKQSPTDPWKFDPDKPSCQIAYTEPTRLVNPTVPVGQAKSRTEKIVSPPPPQQMTDSEKIGMGLTTAIVMVFLVLPVELALIDTTISSSAACLAGQVEFCLADIPLTAMDIAVADFAVSLTLYTYKSISNGSKGKFKWTIIPALFGRKP